MSTIRVRKYKTQDEMQRALDEFITTGYRVKEQGENTILVRKVDNGNLIVLVLLICFFLLPGILYFWYKRTHADTVLMKLEQ